MVSFQLVYAHLEMLKQKIIGWDIFELTLQNDVKKPLKLNFKGIENKKCKIDAF